MQGAPLDADGGQYAPPQPPGPVCAPGRLHHNSRSAQAHKHRALLPAPPSGLDAHDASQMRQERRPLGAPAPRRLNIDGRGRLCYKEEDVSPR